MVSITWFAHACFLIQNEQGARVLMDPYHEDMGYAVPAVDAQLVTVSHGHGDHNNLAMVKGHPRVVDSAQRLEQDGFSLYGVETEHDDQQGTLRGHNLAFVVECGGLRLCHLGDLGHQLTQQQRDAIGKVDVLMVPVGGFYTIDARGAFEVSEALKPRVVLPMHYRTDVNANSPLATERPFLDLMQSAEYTLLRRHSSTAEFSRSTFQRRSSVVVLDHLY